MSWFARRFPEGHPSNAVKPASWQGLAVAGAFAVGMLLAAVAFAIVGMMFGVLWGALAFVVLACAAGAGFIFVAVRTSAPTVSDTGKDHA